LGSLKGRDHSEALGVEGRIIINIKEIGFGDVDWIHLA
jgi:hypothetical protein